MHMCGLCPGMLARLPRITCLWQRSLLELLRERMCLVEALLKIMHCHAAATKGDEEKVVSAEANGNGIVMSEGIGSCIVLQTEALPLTIAAPCSCNKG